MPPQGRRHATRHRAAPPLVPFPSVIGGFPTMGKLVSAAKKGKKRDMLVALRDEIAEQIEATSSGRDMAALSKRLIEVVEQIEDMDAATAQTANPLQAARKAVADGD